MKNNRYYIRIDFIEDINILSEKVCMQYGFGKLNDTEVIEIGYEDFNAIISTVKGKFFMKVFSNSRTDEEALDCINRTNIAGINNVQTPKVYKNMDGDILSIINIGDSRFRVSVIEYINGKNYFDLHEKPNLVELEEIVNIASNLSKIDYKPTFIYDTWAITSFCKEYEEKRVLFDKEIKDILDPIYKEFKNFDYNLLPKSFIHGDMLSTNLMKDINNKIWLIDFSVSNYTARINEIIVICDDIALIENDENASRERINHVFNLWCQKVNATEFEKDSFKLLFKVQNAINIMNSTYEQINGNNSDETIMHFNVGIFGLHLFE